MEKVTAKIFINMGINGGELFTWAEQCPNLGGDWKRAPLAYTMLLGGSLSIAFYLLPKKETLPRILTLLVEEIYLSFAECWKLKGMQHVFIRFVTLWILSSLRPKIFLPPYKVH